MVVYIFSPNMPLRAEKFLALPRLRFSVRSLAGALARSSHPLASAPIRPPPPCARLILGATHSQAQALRRRGVETEVAGAYAKVRTSGVNRTFGVETKVRVYK